MTPTPARIVFHAQESQLSQSARDIMVDGGFTNVRTAFEPSALPDNSARIRVRRGDATGAEALVSGYAVEPTVRRVYCQFTATLEILYTRRRREQNETEVDGIERATDEKRGAIRELFDVGSFPFNDVNLPGLIVTDIMPLAGEESVDREKHFDIILERFRLTYEYRQSEIPTPSAA